MINLQIQTLYFWELLLFSYCPLAHLSQRLNPIRSEKNMVNFFKIKLNYIPKGWVFHGVTFEITEIEFPFRDAFISWQQLKLRKSTNNWYSVNLQWYSVWLIAYTRRCRSGIRWDSGNYSEVFKTVYLSILRFTATTQINKRSW